MQEMCRDRLFDLPVAIFNVFTCSMCYKYLFHFDNQLTPHPSQPWKLVPSPFGMDNYSANFSVVADVTNVTSRDFVCDALSAEDCTRWMDCCYAAIACCESQLSTPTRNLSVSDPFCPRTWDGYGCFGDTEPSSRAYLQCPSYVEHSSITGNEYI